MSKIKSKKSKENLFGRVRVSRFSCHEIEEGIEKNVATVVRIDDGHDALEVDVALLVFAEGITQTDQT